MNFLAWTNKSKNLAQTHQNFVLLHDGVTVKFRNSDTATIHNTQCTVPITQYTVHNIKYMVYSAHQTVCTQQYTIHIAQCTKRKHSVQCTTHSVQCSTVHTSVYTNSSQYKIYNTYETICSEIRKVQPCDQL